MSAHAVKFGRSPVTYWESYLAWVVDLGLSPQTIVAGDALISDDGTEVTFWTFYFEPDTNRKLYGPSPICHSCGRTDGGLHPLRHQVTVPLLKDPKEYNLVVLAIRP